MLNNQMSNVKGQFSKVKCETSNVKAFSTRFNSLISHLSSPIIAHIGSVNCIPTVIYTRIFCITKQDYIPNKHLTSISVLLLENFLFLMTIKLN